MSSRKFARHLWILVPLAVIVTLIVIGFQSASEDGEKMPALIRVGVLPDQDEKLLKKQHGPLLEYLSRELGLETKLLIPANYDDLVRRAVLGEFDLVYLGGLTFIQAEAQNAVVPVVMRNIDLNFVSYFIARTEDTAHEIHKFSGRKFSFGPSRSTSGHLMPRRFLKTMDIEPESFFSEVRYSGGHDKTINLVAEGTVDIGVANARLVERMIEAGQIDPKKFRIVWETPPYAGNVWAVRAGISDNLRMRIINAFLKLSRTDPHHQAVLERQGAANFMPVDSHQFARLREIALDLGMVATQSE